MPFLLVSQLLVGHKAFHELYIPIKNWGFVVTILFGMFQWEFPSCKMFNIYLRIMIFVFNNLQPTPILRSLHQSYVPTGNPYMFQRGTYLCRQSTEVGETSHSIWVVVNPHLVYEPPRDKTNYVAVRPAKTQISLGIRPVWSESSLCA